MAGHKPFKDIKMNSTVGTSVLAVVIRFNKNLPRRRLVSVIAEGSKIVLHQQEPEDWDQMELETVRSISANYLLRHRTIGFDKLSYETCMKIGRRLHRYVHEHKVKF